MYSGAADQAPSNARKSRIPTIHPMATESAKRAGIQALRSTSERIDSTVPCDHTFSVLYDHGGLGVGDYRCKAKASPAGSEEESREHSIVFVRRGVFEKHVGNRTTLGTPNSVLFYPKGEVHQTGHPASGGDDCTVFMLDPAILRDVLEPSDPGADHRPNPFPLEWFTLDSSLFLRHWRVFKKLGTGSVDSVAIQEELLDLCAEVLGEGTRRSGRPRPAQRPSTRRAHRDLAQDTATLLGARFSEPLSLHQIAEDVCSSQYHLSRVFRREIGVPIHRYLNRIRLRTAVDRLASGHSDLTMLALELGFASRGHLSDAFRMEYDVAPSALRRELAIN